MKLVAEYRKLAEEYRRLSDKLTRPKDKEALELMARAWDKIASEREDRFRSHAMRELLGHVHQQTVREPVSQRHLTMLFPYFIGGACPNQLGKVRHSVARAAR